MVFQGNLKTKLCLSSANKQLKCRSQRLLHHIMHNVSARKHKALTRNSNELWETVKHEGLGSKGRKNNSNYPMFLLQRPFVCSGGTECCHTRRPFLPGTIFYKPFREDLSLPFPVVWPWLSCRERGTAKPKCRCSTWQALHGVSWPDKSRERNTAIYLYSLWFCVLRPRLPVPGWIFCLRTKTDGWLSIDILKGTFRINVRSICVNRVWGFDVWSTPSPNLLLIFFFFFQNRLWLKTDYPPVKTWHFVWWSIMTAAGKVWNLSIDRITSLDSFSMGGWPHHCQTRYGTNLEELPWIACTFRFVKLCTSGPSCTSVSYIRYYWGVCVRESGKNWGL